MVAKIGEANVAFSTSGVLDVACAGTTGNDMPPTTRLIGVMSTLIVVEQAAPEHVDGLAPTML